MPTIIDSLIVQLSLDPSGFDEGQRRAVQSLRRFEAQSERSGQVIQGSLGSSFRSIAGVILGLDAPLALMFRHLEAVITKSDDTTKSLKRLGEAGAKTEGGAGERIEEGAKAGSHGMVLLAGSALVALAAVMALQKAMGALKDVSLDIAKTGVLAAGAGMSVQDLSALSAALFLRSGGLVSEDETKETANRLNLRRSRALRGEDPDYFTTLGLIGVKNLQENGLNLWRDLAARFAQMPLTTTGGKLGAIDLGTQLGLTQAQVLTMRELGQNFGKVIEDARKFEITPSQVEAADRFNKALAEMEEQFKKLARILFEVNEGVMESFVKDLSTIAQIGQALAKHEWTKVFGLIGDLFKNQFSWHKPWWLGGADSSQVGEQSAGIIAAARAAGASPAAIQAMLAGALGEGGLSETWKSGDKGTSFGPWQLHQGGELDRYLAEGNRTGDINAQTLYVLKRLNEIYPGFSQITDPVLAAKIISQFEHSKQGADYYEGMLPKARDIYGAVGQTPDTSGSGSGAPAAMQSGGIVLRDQMIRAHAGEMVFPADVTSLLLQSIQRGNSQDAMAGPVSNDNSVTLSGDINVYTTATDPQGIAQAVQDSIRRNLMAANASTGFVG